MAEIIKFKVQIIDVRDEARRDACTLQDGGLVY